MYLKLNFDVKDAFVSAGLLAVPLTAFTSESGEVVHLARRSNDTLNSDMLGAGTPPPSYAEVLAYISTETIDQPGAVFANPGQLIHIKFTITRKLEF